MTCDERLIDGVWDENSSVLIINISLHTPASLFLQILHPTTITAGSQCPSSWQESAAERQRVYWTPWPIHWSRSHTKHFNWARYNNGSLHNVGISWRACQPVYGNSNIFDWKIFSATEYFTFCFLQEILIWLVVIYFLFHIFFLAANRLSIDTGTIHPTLPSDSEGVTANTLTPNQRPSL